MYATRPEYYARLQDTRHRQWSEWLLYFLGTAEADARD